MPSLKSKLQQHRRVSLHICAIPSATVAQTLAAAGADGIIVDLEHGAMDYETAHAMIAATAGTDCAPLVRVGENTALQAKRALDLGAEGLVFPMIRTAKDAAEAVASMRYPPGGTRGFGPFMAQARWQTGLMGYRDAIEPDLVCALLIETREAVENIEKIVQTDGIDLLIPAPFDLSTDLGIPGQFDHPDFKAAINKVDRTAKTAAIPTGGIALDRSQAEALKARDCLAFIGVDQIWLQQKTEETQSWIN